MDIRASLSAAVDRYGTAAVARHLGVAPATLRVYLAGGRVRGDALVRIERRELDAEPGYRFGNGA